MNDIELIDSLGGTTSVAKICGIRPQAVSQWKKNGIPKSVKNLLMHRKLLDEEDKEFIANPSD